MKAACLLLSAALAACATVPAGDFSPRPASPWPLRNAGFESAPRPGERCPAGWMCTMHGNASSFRFTLEGSAAAEGARSLCIERVTPEPWAVASQAMPAAALRGRKVRFSVALRGEALGGPGAGPWVLVHGISGVLLHEERVTLLGPRWERRAIEILVPAQAETLEMGATLQGPGRACLDDARLDPA